MGRGASAKQLPVGGCLADMLFYEDEASGPTCKTL
jgi:hypothetical protein